MADDVNGSTSRHATCPDCGQEVFFLAETFGNICSSCGLILDEQQVIDSTAPFPVSNRRPAQNAGSSHWTPSATARSVARRGQNSGEGLELINRLQSRSVEQQIKRVLSVLGYEYLKDDVQALIQRSASMANTIEDGGQRDVGSSGHGPKQSTRRALPYNRMTYKGQLGTTVVAACFARVKQRDPNISLDHLCKRVQLPVGHVKTVLAEIELLVKGSTLAVTTYDVPNAFLKDHIAFLCHQLDLPTRKRSHLPAEDFPAPGFSIFNNQDKSFLASAQLDTLSFLQLAEDLGQLCADHGLSNRSARRGPRLDLSICAWAILMLAIEGQIGKPSTEGLMAQTAAWAPGWQAGRKMGGYTKAQLGFGSEHDVDGLDDSEILDEATLSEARRLTIRTIEELVKRRYAEISRMLSIYIAAMPWFSERSSSNAPRKKAKTHGRRGHIDIDGKDRIAMRALSRLTVARHMREAIKFRHEVEASLASQAHSLSKLWSVERDPPPFKLKSPTSPFSTMSNSRICTVDDDDESDSSTSSENQVTLAKKYSWALFKLPTADRAAKSRDKEAIGRGSELARSLDSALLTEQSLREMDDRMIDLLLFRADELDSYIRTSEEVDVLRRLRLDQGDWDTRFVHSDNTVTFTGTETSAPQDVPIAENRRPVHSRSARAGAGRRTKAKDEAAFNRVMRSLFDDT